MRSLDTRPKVGNHYSMALLPGFGTAADGEFWDRCPDFNQTRPNYPALPISPHCPELLISYPGPAVSPAVHFAPFNGQDGTEASEPVAPAATCMPPRVHTHQATHRECRVQWRGMACHAMHDSNVYVDSRALALLAVFTLFMPRHLQAALT